MTLTESLRFPHVYSHPGKVLVVARTDGDITLTLEGAQDVAPVTKNRRKRKRIGIAKSWCE